ncbi:hypothetical protein HDU81_009672 [Chytriomyces hyalinus]|nr:hypothetical protein HDU81_009672 [Chytriomyces hyalinus]
MPPNGSNLTYHNYSSHTNLTNNINNINYTLHLLGFYLPIIHGSIDLLVFVFLLYFIAVIELPGRKVAITTKSIFSTMNLILMNMWLGCSVSSFAQAFLSQSGGTSAAAFVFNIVGLGMVEVNYVWYAWLRSSDILHTQTSTSYYRFISILKNILPFLTQLPIILVFTGDFDRPGMSFKSFITVSIPGTAAVLLDLFLAVSFMNHIQKMKTDMEGVQKGTQQTADGEERLTLVARYGLVCATGGLFVASCYLIAYLCKVLGDAHPSESLELWYQVFWLLKDWILFVTGMALVVMKTRNLHESGLKHKGNVERYLGEVRKKDDEKKRTDEYTRRMLEGVERKALASYARDAPMASSMPASALSKQPVSSAAGVLGVKEKPKAPTYSATPQQTQHTADALAPTIASTYLPPTTLNESSGLGEWVSYEEPPKKIEPPKNERNSGQKDQAPVVVSAEIGADTETYQEDVDEEGVSGFKITEKRAASDNVDETVTFKKKKKKVVK